MFTTEEIVQILTMMIMRKNSIAQLADNPYVTQISRDMMEKEVQVMESIQKKLIPYPVGG